MIGESILELHKTNATDESIKSYEYNEYQPITGTKLNSAGQITITLAGQEVKQVNYPGQTTTLLGLVSYSADYHKGCGMAKVGIQIPAVLQF